MFVQMHVLHTYHGPSNYQKHCDSSTIEGDLLFIYIYIYTIYQYNIYIHICVLLLFALNFVYKGIISSYSNLLVNQGLDKMATQFAEATARTEDAPAASASSSSPPAAGASVPSTSAWSVWWPLGASDRGQSYVAGIAMHSIVVQAMLKVSTP